MPKNKEKTRKNILPVTVLNRTQNETRLPVVNPRTNSCIVFSYKYFNCSSVKNSEFNNCFNSIYNYAEWITLCLERISKFSTMSIGEISQSGRSVRFHPVECEHLVKLKSILMCTGLDVDKIFPQNEAQNYYELSLGTASGRVFGYLIENHYYILLLDPNHLVYKCTSKGGNYDLLYKNYDPWNSLLTNTNI